MGGVRESRSLLRSGVGIHSSKSLVKKVNLDLSLNNHLRLMVGQVQGYALLDARPPRRNKRMKKLKKEQAMPRQLHNKSWHKPLYERWHKWKSIIASCS